MQLEFTSEQEDLRDSVRVVLERECPMTLVRAVIGTGVAPDALWKHMVELGWTALTVPEAAGGLGQGPVELAVVVEELGRVVAPGPFLATATQFTPAVREAGNDAQQQRFLGPIAEGIGTGTLAITEPGAAADPLAVRAQASRDGGEWVLSGVKTFVLDGDTADEVVVVAREPGTVGEEGVVALVTPRDALRVTPRRPLDATRSLVDLELDGARVSDDRRLGEPGPATVRVMQRALEEATAMLAVEMVGASQTIFDVALDYAKQREQFGVPIGSFQAIKHKFADMLIALERARATAYFAALCVAADDPRRAIAVSTAKAAAGDCQRRFGKEGIQILGGIGYTWEHDMHLYVRRVTTDGQLLGTAHEHRRRIAALIGL